MKAILLPSLLTLFQLRLEPIRKVIMERLAWVTTSAFSRKFLSIIPNTEGLMTMPASMYPLTLGSLNRLAKLPKM